MLNAPQLAERKVQEQQVQLLHECAHVITGLLRK